MEKAQTKLRSLQIVMRRGFLEEYFNFLSVKLDSSYYTGGYQTVVQIHYLLQT